MSNLIHQVHRQTHQADQVLQTREVQRAPVAQAALVTRQAIQNQVSHRSQRNL